MVRLVSAPLKVIVLALSGWSLCGQVNAQSEPGAEHSFALEHGEHAQVATAHEGGEHERGEHEHEHRPLSLGLDFVLGFGAYPLLLPTRGGAGTESESEEEGVPAGWMRNRDVGVHVESILIAGSYEVAEHVGVGLRVPLTLGSVPTTDGSSHGTFAFGNLELEGETEIELSETAALVLSLGVALPTAQGSEEPELEDGELSSDYDRFVLNRIAASARGFEDNALFEVDRLGIIPKVGFDLRENHVLFQPFVKLESLIATNSELERSFVAELVFGMFFGYEVSEHFDLGARLWGSAAFLDEVEQVGVVEPQVRAHFAPVDVLLGGIIPFAGELTEPQFGGIRLGVTARL
ncbi:MAG TPA: hypothetical protein VFG30_19030 [Polyangiales bacterium]|nr:hypothetical protein [Polyangiales bacterium]